MKLFSKQSKQIAQVRRGAPVMFEQLETRQHFSVTVHSNPVAIVSTPAVVVPVNAVPTDPCFYG